MADVGAELAGRTLARTYQVERLLGSGGMGAVYVARHLRTGGQVALKVLRRDAAADAEVYRRFQDEARIVSALRHPHIVQVTDFDQAEDGTPFIVMELLEGVDLHHRLREVGRLPLPEALEIARQVGSALHAAHERGVVHRDVKPQNIFLCRHDMADSAVELAKVVDFGISKIRRSASQVTQDQMLLGTPHFMSPEAALGQNAQLDGRADQFALAVILYRCLSGVLPFDAPEMMGVLYQVVQGSPTPLLILVPGLPEPIAAAIERAMSKRKEDRFPTMADFVRALCGAPGASAAHRVGGGSGAAAAIVPAGDRGSSFSSTLRRASGQLPVATRPRGVPLAAGIGTFLLAAGFGLPSLLRRSAAGAGSAGAAPVTVAEPRAAAPSAAAERRPAPPEPAAPAESPHAAGNNTPPPSPRPRAAAPPKGAPAGGTVGAQPKKRPAATSIRRPAHKPAGVPKRKIDPGI